MKNIKKYNDFLNENNLEWDEVENEEFGNDFIEFLSTFKNKKISIDLKNKILDGELDVKKYDHEQILYNGNPMKIGRFIKKIYPDLSPKEIEDFSSGYKLFFSQEEKLDSWIAINISKWENGYGKPEKININSYPVNNNFNLDDHPSVETKKVHGYINNEVRNLNRGGIKSGIINHLKELGYDFTIKDEFYSVDYYILYFNNIKDIFSFIRDFEEYNNK